MALSNPSKAYMGFDPAYSNAGAGSSGWGSSSTTEGTYYVNTNPGYYNARYVEGCNCPECSFARQEARAHTIKMSNQISDEISGRLKRVEERMDKYDDVKLSEFKEVWRKKIWCRCGNQSMPEYLDRTFNDGLTEFKAQWLKYSGHTHDDFGDEIDVDDIINNHDRRCADERISVLYSTFCVDDSSLYHEL